MKVQIKTMVYSSLMAALIAVATLFIHIPIPMQGGYCNLGDAFILASGCLIGYWAAPAAAIGSAMADLLLGYAVYAPATALIKGVMGLIAGGLCLRQKNIGKRILFMILAEIIMIGGYFLFETILYGAAYAAGSLMGNGSQGVMGVLIACILWPILERVKKLIH